MKKIIALILTLTVVVLTGCRTQVVTVEVTPADAHVIANGVAYNNGSPFFIEASTGSQLLITAYKDGYREKLHVVDYSLSTVGIVELSTSFLLVPLLGLLADTAWELDENNVKLVLEPLNNEVNELPAVESTSSADDSKNKRAKELFKEI